MNRRFDKRKLAFIIPIGILAIALFLLVFGGAVMLLWNNILVQVLHVSVISFKQALGILILSKILFGGFRGAHWGRHRWREKMHERWEKMTPEEREKFQQEWKNRCGHRFGRRFEEQKSEQQQ